MTALRDARPDEPFRVRTWRPAAGFAVAAVTRTGTRRDVNQDALVVVPPEGDRPWLVAVADGVGGQVAGEVAATAATEALAHAWRDAWEARGPRPDPSDALASACGAADAAVREVTTAPATRGAATTLTAVVIGPRGTIVAQAGDSGAWARDDTRMRGAPVRRVTPVHTVITAENEARSRDGLPPLTDEEAARHPQRGAITRYLGMARGCEFDLAAIASASGAPAILVACTDGITDILGVADLDRAVLAGDAARIADTLARAVDARQGRDDATAIVLVATHAGHAEGSGRDAADPFGLRPASRVGADGFRAWSRRATAIGTFGLAAVATGAAGAWLWPEALRLVDAFRGSDGADPVAAARDYLAQWATGNHDTLWLRIDAGARRRVPQEEFARRHRDFMAEIGAKGVSGSPVTASGAIALGGVAATVTADLSYASTRFGEMRARVAMPFLWEDGAWRLDWSPTVLLPDLTGGRRVRATSDSPVRGSLLDRMGRTLAGPVTAAPGAALAPTPTPFAIAGQGTGSVPSSATTPSATPARPGAPRVATRAYPAGEVAGPLVGYTAEATPAELATLAGRGAVPGDRVGRAGLERVAEDYLAGARGSRLDLVEPSGVVVTTLATVPPGHGGAVVTTLDLDLQRVAEAALGARAGSVIAIDLPSGAIRAAATWPRYDPAAFETGTGVAALLEDARTPLLDRSVQGLYPPGSTFKVVTMAAAMAHGVATPDTEFTCTGTWTGLPGVSQRCWLASGHGTITLAAGLTHSCNSVFYELGRRLDALDAGILPAVARQAGLGGATGAFPGEEPTGLVPDAAWKRATLKEPWTPGDTVNLAIGQGQLLVTPLQLVAVYGMVATGRTVVPSILGAVRLPGGNVERALPPPVPGSVVRAWAPDALAVMRASLAAVISSPDGTAVGAFAGSKVAAIVAGKTGTAENQPGKPTHAWFAGYGPIAAPSIAVVAMLEQGGEGSRVAAPIARKVLEAALG